MFHVLSYELADIDWNLGINLTVHIYIYIMAFACATQNEIESTFQKNQKCIKTLVNMTQGCYTLL